MASTAAQLGRYSKLSWTTAFFMGLFHIGAVWALFQFTWAGLAVFLRHLLHFALARHRHGVPPAAHAPVVQDAESRSSIF